MTPLPLFVTVLVVGAALVAVLVLLVLRRRRTPAGPGGPRTVAELVELRGVAAAPARAVEPVPPAPAPAPSAPAPPEPVPVAAVPAPAPPPSVPARPVPAVVTTGAVGEPVALLGDDVPWRRAALMNAPRVGLPEPRAATAVPARPVRVTRPLGGSSRRDRRAAAPDRAASRPAPDAAPGPGRDAAGARAAVAPVVDPPRSGSSVRGAAAADRADRDADPAPAGPAVGPATGPAAVGPVANGSSVAGPPATRPAIPGPAAVEAPAAPVAVAVPERPAVDVVSPPVAAPPVPARPATALPAAPPAAPASLRPTAEQAAADVALLRTFGAADLASRPDRAPDIALTGPVRPEPEPQAGTAQPVRFRVVGRDGAPLADAAVALLDAAGRETATAKGASGELSAPRPGTYVLVATAADHQAAALALAVADAPVEAELLLVRSAVLRGSVRGEDGPVVGARIALVQDGEVVETADSDGDGAYRVDGLAAGEYAVSVAAAGCEPDIELVLLPDGAEVVHDVDLAPAGVAAGQEADGG